MILVSRYEGFPMTVLEAWKYGNPCLVTDGTNVADEIVRNKLGWRTDLSSHSIANTIELALEEYQKYKDEFIKKSKKYVCSNYSWPCIALKSFQELEKHIGNI